MFRDEFVNGGAEKFLLGEFLQALEDPKRKRRRKRRWRRRKRREGGKLVKC